MTWNEIKSKLNSTESVVSLVLGIIVVLTAGILVVNFVKSRKVTTPKQVTTANEMTNFVPKTLLPTTHKVAEGEDLWSISLRYYKSSYNWVTLAQVNKLANPDILVVGQELNIPKADPINPEGSINGDGISIAAITANKYKVVEGDDLWNISCRAYGDCYKWTQIAQANKLANPDVIEVDQELSLPR